MAASSRSRFALALELPTEAFLIAAGRADVSLAEITVRASAHENELHVLLLLMVQC